MAALRAHGGTSRASLEALDPEDPDRVERCVRSLVTDGLAVELDERLDLPA